MSMYPHVRVYIVMPEGGIWRLVRDHPEHAYPQLASTMQRVIHIIYRGSELLKIVGSYASFDAQGRRDFLQKIDASLEAHTCRQRIAVIRKSERPNIGMIRYYEREAARWTEQHFWDVPNDLVVRIANDLMGSQRPHGTKAIPILKPEPINETRRNRAHS
jgi:hypothetical protein